MSSLFPNHADAFHSFGTFGETINNLTIAAVIPAPTTVGLFGLGLLGLAVFRPRRKAKA